MNYLLDTCVISELVSKKPNLKVLNWLSNLDESHVYLSVVTLGEIQRGIHKLPNSKRRQTLESWLEQDLQVRFAGRILPLTMDTLIRWGTLMGNLDVEGKPMALLDALIASTALHHKLRLVTRNEKDFSETGLTIDNPWKL
jgi:toxin FitB